jgi:hypothetical protein
VGGQGAAQTGGAGAPGAAGRVVFKSGVDETGLPDLQGEELLKALPGGEAQTVKALAEGRMAFPTGAALRSPYWSRMLQAVSRYDPTFDAVNYQSRAATRKDFTSGASAKNLSSFNTAIGHLDALDHAIAGLGNYASPVNNWLAHRLANVTGTDQRLARFEAAKNAVADELTRAFRGSGGALADVEGWKHQLDSAKNPETLHATVQTMVDLLHSRIEALGEQYNQGMGTTKAPLELLTPKAAKTMARLAGLPEPATAQEVAQEQAQAERPAPAQKRTVAPRLGQPSQAPQRQAPGGAPRLPSIPPDAVRELKANATPQMRQYFDQTFGVGAAARVLGGR